MSLAASQPITQMPSGASGISTVERSSTNWLPSNHSKVARASPGQGSPPGGIASIVHSPIRTSSSFSACSAVG